jgi:hypothetical protein
VWVFLDFFLNPIDLVGYVMAEYPMMTFSTNYFCREFYHLRAVSLEFKFSNQVT